MILSAVLLLPFTADAGELKLGANYLRPDGAILTYHESTATVDPYFPTKALLIAADMGMDTTSLSQGWINWLLERQEANGLFSRFCLDEGKEYYRACNVADADDAMMAMWIELLYRNAPEGGLPVNWHKSAKKAELQLDALYDSQNNIYLISKALPVGLLMDNIEIYAALRNSGKEARSQGDLRQSSRFYSKAARLKSGIMTTFWDKDSNLFKASTQERKEFAFYPDHVAQVIPMLHGFQASPMATPAQTYASWMQSHKQEWLDLIGNEYPWGLVAVLAATQGDMMTANCWVQMSAPHRTSTTVWDVLDEAAYQSVEQKLAAHWPNGLPACEGVIS